MIGQTLNNRYKVTARLGKGAMGIVYRATDTQTAQEVALKVISSELSVDPEMLERFKREGAALRKLKHPNIVAFMDAFQYDEQYVIVMEYISGGSLHDLIKSGPLSIERARRIALELCDALIRSHHLDIIHRDIKPENVLMDEDGTPKLADFGVAKLSEGTRMTRSGTQVGTPYYMAPEAWKGETLNGQADIWSLGVLLFEMLTGQVPFGGDTGPVVMNKVFTSQPPDLKKLRSDTPASLIKTVSRMLTRDKKHRYQTMRQLAADLERGQLATPPTRNYGFIFIILGIVVAGILTFLNWPSSAVPVTPAPTETITLAAPATSTPFIAPVESIGVLKIVSSLPLTGSSLTQTQTIVNAMELRLEQAGGKACAGKYSIVYESWDDASAALGQWDPAVETENANKAAADASIIAYLGTFNSGAAKLSIPILNVAGPLTMISPANTNPGLTKPDRDFPGVTASYYPSGVRNYARVVPADDVQGEAAANFVKNELDAATVYILDDQGLYGKGVADVFEATAAKIGLTVVGHESIDPQAGDYKALMTRISTSNGGSAPDVIYVGMVIDNHAVQLLKDKVAIMGDNETVKYVGPDGIQTQALIDEAGANVAEGVYASVTGLPFDKLPETGRKFVTDYEAKFGLLSEPYSVYGYETMSVALRAIEDVCATGGDPTDRAAINSAVHAIKNFDGALGTWSFDANGDTSLTDMTFYQVKNGIYIPIGIFK